MFPYAKYSENSIHLRQTDGRSDLDFLVEPLPGTTLFDLGAIQVELEEALGIAVDAMTPGDLPVKFKDQVLRDAIFV